MARDSRLYTPVIVVTRSTEYPGLRLRASGAFSFTDRKMAMRYRLRTAAITVSLALGGTLFAVSGSTCSTFSAESALATADLCFIFDCQNGILGGTIDPCAIVGTDPDGNEVPLLVDCP